MFITSIYLISTRVLSLMAHVTHDGTTTLILPSLNRHSATRHIDGMQQNDSYHYWNPTCQLTCPTIAMERASTSNTRLWKHGCSVMHDLCLQHLFLSAVGIRRHLIQMHQLGTPQTDGCCPSGCCLCGASIISLADRSLPVRLYTSIFSWQQLSIHEFLCVFYYFNRFCMYRLPVDHGAVLLAKLQQDTLVMGPNGCITQVCIHFIQCCLYYSCIDVSLYHIRTFQN